jgi:hypothetical protein
LKIAKKIKMLKALNNKYVKIFIIFCIFFYFFKTIELNTLSKEFLLFSKSYFFLSILLFIPNTFLSIYKWFLLTKKFNNNNIFSLYKQFSFIFFLSDIIHNPTLVEVSKFISLKKISNFEKTAIIFNDKIIIILTKAIYTFFFLLLLNQSKFIEFIIAVFNEKKLYTLLIILSILFLIIIAKFKKNILTYYKKYLSSDIIERKKIFLIEIIKNILMSCLYFLSFLQFTTFENAIFFAAISPLIETFIRLQFFTTFGFRELILFFFGTYLGLDQNIILSSLFITFVTLSTSTLNLLLSLLIKRQVRTKIFKDNNVTFVLNDIKSPGNSDFFTLIKLISKKNKRIKLDNSLNLNLKKIIIQENFLNLFYFIRLIIFCTFYKGKLLILLTEFFTKTKNGVSYNNFERNKYTSNNVFLLLLIIFYCKTINILGYNSSKLSNIHYKAYHKLRYLSTAFFSKYAHAFVVAHPRIVVPFKNLKKKIIQFPYIFPTIKYNRKWESKNCKFAVEFTGQLTRYRLKELSNLKLNRKIFSFDQEKHLSKINNNSYIFSNKINTDKKVYFSYHVEKNKEWRYSSPTRYFNSLKNKKIPTINKNFNDIFSKICLTRSVFNEKSKIQILKKIKILNQYICQVNDQSKKNICNLVNF